MNKYITEGWKEQGIEVKEESDHILEVRKDGKVVARFSQTGVEIENVLKEIEVGKYDN